MPTTRKKNNDSYEGQEAQERFEQALRGARMAEPKPLKDAPKKRGESQGKGQSSNKEKNPNR